MLSVNVTLRSAPYTKRTWHETAAVHRISTISCAVHTRTPAQPHVGLGLFLSVYVDDIKVTGKKQNIDPMWKLLNKEVDLGEPTSFLDHVFLGCTQRQCEIIKDIVDNYRAMFESRISAGGTEKLPYSVRIFVFLHGLMIWKVMRRNVWSDIVNYQTRRLNNSTKYLHLHRWPPL